MAGIAAKYKVKGTHITQVRVWIDKHLGEESFTTLTSQLSETKGWPGVVLAGSWYDVEPLQALLSVASVRTKRSVELIATEIAEMNARTDLTSVYRAFLRLAGPPATLAATALLWKNYVAFATAKAVKNERGAYIGECTGVPRHLLAWACGCWLGFIPTAITLSGGKNCVGEIVARRRQQDSDLWMIEFAAKYD